MIKPESGNAVIRIMTASAVVAVASFAAVVSYSHIYDLGRAHGQTVLDSRLLPLSVDGLILAASLLLLHEARNNRQPPALARWMLAVGVGGTVGANVLYGTHYGPVGALLSAWPGLAFVGSTEQLMYLVRAGRTSAPAAVVVAEPVAIQSAYMSRTSTAHASGQDTDTASDAGADITRTRRRTSRPDTAVAVTRLRDRDPDMTTADIAARLGITDRTVRRHLAAARLVASPAAA